ncbi:beta-galactosidase 2 isoform X2 [Cryptomeria japonica]|uniref:beta-galactosidase 2 isoform X2 n=1 Tax=Cryptomeria japonica TaxID=3369 RepID=UPI0027DA1351|nr:beta-galactosidase 2 isoform X2 [Cryptomeria japonica]
MDASNTNNASIIPGFFTYNFEGRFDLVKFVKLVQQEGLYVSLRIGPYVSAEWNFGGLPVWLKFVPGIRFRTDNEPFKNAMQKFTKKVVDQMKSEGLFEPQGGPIIMAQIENEYKGTQTVYGHPGIAYMNWAAQMAVALDTGVPWIMCKQDDAPDPIINTCNGFYCDKFVPNKPYKPAFWTEAWSGWFTEYGGATTQRPVEDLAFAVANFLQEGGSFVNYYMYHGGTNFGRTAGGPFITTSYDYDAPIDEYGLIRKPKWGHLKALHKAIKLCEPALVSGDPVVNSLGNNQKSYVYSAGAGKCAAFLENFDANSDATVIFNNKNYYIPAWSISILPDCRSVVFNTAKVSVQRSQMNMTPVGRLVWESFKENVATYEDGSITDMGLLEQINTTRGNTDYLWYITRVEVGDDEPLIKNGGISNLSIQSAGHAFHIFVNGEYLGTQYGKRESPRLRYSSDVRLRVGTNTIALLSMTVGLQYIGPNFESRIAGIIGPVTLSGFKEGTRSLSRQKWSYQLGFKGQSKDLHMTSGQSSVQWVKGAAVPQRQPLTWYKAVFDAPDGQEPVGLDLSMMGKGEAWINGQSIGRYWHSFLMHGNCSNGCNYRGQFRPTKCTTDCSHFSQQWYHIPRSWLQPRENLLVLLEEIGGDVSTVSIGTRAIDTVCVHVSESHPQRNNKGRQLQIPKVRLKCGTGQKISAIKFASYGTPSGECGSFQKGVCHARTSFAVVNKKCVGLRTCSLPVSSELFGGDPCPQVQKSIAIQAVCS